MDDSGRSQLAHSLHGRRDAVAEAWYAAIARTSFAPLPAAQVRHRLSEAVAQAIELLLAERFKPESARQIGADLARLHYTQPEVLGRTIGVLSAELVKGLPADQACGLVPSLAALLEGVATGFAQQCTAIHLSEQEAIRGALVAELRAAEGRLREAHDGLAEQVELRTAELRASQEQLREVLENIDAVVVSVDPDGRFTFVSPPVTNVFGLLPEQMIGRSFQEFVYPEDLPRVVELAAHPYPDRRNAFEFRFVTGSGEPRWVHASTRILFDGDRYVAAHGIITDVTDRRRAEEALRESEERWRSLVANAPDSVFTTDAEGRVVFVNRLPPSSKYTREDMVGRFVYDPLLPEHREAAKASVEHVLATGNPARYEAAVRQANGTLVWYSGHIGAVWRDGKVVGATLIARDITAQKKADELKDNLLRDVAHELMTPLAKAQLSLELLLSRLDGEPADPEDLTKYASLALDSVQRLTHMARAILDLSRLEAGTRFIAGERVYMGELMASVVQDMEPLASAKGLTLAARVAEPLPPVTGDGEKLARALRNLVDNAIKCSAAGQIEIAVEGRQDEIEVSVRDEGRGIEPDHLQRIFDHFFQEDAQTSGLGLGLPICKAIVEAHGGRIWAESPGKGRGATLRFTLPAAGRAAD